MKMTPQSYDNDNIFAKIIRGEIPSFKLHEDDKTLAFMDIMPRGRGHCLVIPKAPARNLLDVQPGDLAAVIEVTRKLAIAAQTAFSADGVTIQQFNEAAGGQEVFHLHFHVIPRVAGERMGPAGVMGDMDAIKANAGLIRARLTPG
jgi:histidine triad (HIT) family protein